jgi:GNAT superfamily N-acetyltransferase
MKPDVFDELGEVAVGSRLKRLGDAMVSEAAAVYREYGFPFEARWYPLCALLMRVDSIGVTEASQRLGISQPAVSTFAKQLSKAGLCNIEIGSDDARKRNLSITAAGKSAMLDMQAMWNDVNEAVVELCVEEEIDIVATLSAWEIALRKRSLLERVQSVAADPVRTLPFTDELAPYFESINAEWIAEMFELEPVDRLVLGNPREHIVDPGGEIWFATLRDEVVGTGALQLVEPGSFELTKMGVLSAARGYKVGERLLRRLIYQARRRAARQLFLITNSKCGAAIHLYEKVGFVHSPELLKSRGAKYRRANVAMEYRWP